MDYVGWQRVTEDSLVARGPVEFWGIHGRSTAGSAGTIVVFDGANALGRRYQGYVIPQNTTERHLEEEPIYFERGLFVDIDAGISMVLVRYRPLREEDLVPGHNALAAAEIE